MESHSLTQLPAGYTIQTGSENMQAGRIHGWLAEHSYWAKDIPFQTVQTMIDHSFCVGVCYESRQVGFARFITDYAVFAYLADVYVEEAHRGIGLSKAMMGLLMTQPWVQSLRKLSLATMDAHSLYEQYGFRPLQNPGRMMEITRKDIYPQKTSTT
jgi:GNAT superfamily N-acetyltransferase